MSDNSSEDSDKSGEENKKPAKDQQPGFSFTKSAIADLPSTAVQSIHIENDTPVEVDDEVFVWRDVSPSGTKLPTKTKFKKQDLQKTGKQKPSSVPASKTKAKAPPSKTTASAAKSKPTGSLASNEKVSVKTTTKANGGGSKTKVVSVDSKNRIKERRPSQTSQGKASGGSATKVSETRSKGNSQTKVQSREKNTGRDNKQSRGK